MFSMAFGIHLRVGRKEKERKEKERKEKKRKEMKR
jgi:hypothetical protein